MTSGERAAKAVEAGALDNAKKIAADLSSITRNEYGQIKDEDLARDIADKEKYGRDLKIEARGKPKQDREFAKDVLKAGKKTGDIIEGAYIAGHQAGREAVTEEAAATAEQAYATKVEGRFRRIKTPDQLLAEIARYTDRMSKDGQPISGQLSIQQDAESSRQLLVSNDAQGDVILDAIKEASERLNTDKYVYISSSMRDVTMSRREQDRAERTAGFIKDSSEAEAVAYHERDARRDNEASKSEHRLEINAIEGEEEFGFASRQQLVDSARVRLEAVKEQGNRIGNEAAEAAMDIRERATQELDQGLHNLSELRGQEEGRFVVRPVTGSNEATIEVLRSINDRTLRADVPFEVRNYVDESGVRVQELAFHTGDPRVLTVERWNSSNGQLINSQVIKGDFLTEMAPSVEPKGKFARFMLNRQVVQGKAELSEHLTSETRDRMLTQDSSDAAASRINGGEAYSDYMLDHYVDLGMDLNTARTLTRNKRPKQPKGFFTLLYQSLTTRNNFKTKK